MTGRGLGRAVAFALALLVGVGAAAEARAAEKPVTKGRRWTVAPAGPCATPAAPVPCAGAACAARTPARSRFDPGDVATGTTGSGGAAPPELASFPGPGSCADPSNPCGAIEPTRVAERPPTPPSQPPPAAPSPAAPPGGPPAPPALPPAPPAPVPPGVVESPGRPGTLPGLP